jgi:acetyl esterase/lipase
VRTKQGCGAARRLLTKLEPRRRHGGSWQRGSRDLYRFVGVSLAAQGIVTVVPDYSIFPPARFPMFVEDAARAVRFARERSPQWGGDPARLVLMGHSAGAYIAAMLSFDPQWLGQVGLNSQTDLAGFVGLAGFPANREPDLAHHFRRRQ